MDTAIASVALPFISRDLNIESSQSVLLVVLYNLVLAMTLLPFASLGNRVGLKQLFVAGQLLYVAGAGLCYLATSFEFLLLFRTLQAIGISAALSVAIAIVRSLYPPSKLGKGLGINTIASVSGASLAPVVGGFVIAATSWKWVFAAGLPLAVLSLALARLLPDVERTRGRFDVFGSVLCAVTFGALIIGLETLNYEFHILVSAAIILAGAVAAFIFVRHERNEQLPVLPVDLFRHAALSLSVAAAFAAVLSSWILVLSMPFMLDQFGFTPSAIGSLILPYAITSAVLSPAAGMLSDRVDPALLGTLGLSVAIVGLASFAFLGTDPSHYEIVWRMALCGTGFGMFFSPNARLIVGSVPADRSAPASSLISTTRMFGQALGSTMFGGMLAFGFGGNESVAYFTVALAAIALVCSGARRWCRVPKEE